MKILSEWFHRHFTNPQVIILILTLIIGTAVILTMGNILAPVLAGLVIAYLLDGLVSLLENIKIPRLIAVLLVFLTFMACLLVLLFGLLPRLSIQAGQIVAELPAMITRGQKELMQLPQRYPELISQEQVLTVIRVLQTELGHLGQKLLAFSVASVRGIVTFLVYLILVPFMVFFFMKDKHQIMKWMTDFLPENRNLSIQVYRDVNRQIANYVRGKFIEILVVWVVAYATFYFLNLRFAILLSLVVGLSVLVPYIGVAVVAFPVALVAFYQWGWGPDFIKVVVAYSVIQILDGNLLAPLLLSEVVNLHPIAIIVAVLAFGGLWGFWGVFFAIPLATLIQAVLKAWPQSLSLEAEVLLQPEE